MAASGPQSLRPRAVLTVAALVLVAGSAPAQILPWEVTVAEIEAGRLRNFAQRLSKQNVLYQLHLGQVRKADLVATSVQIDRVIESLGEGNSSYSIPAPWSPEIREQIVRVDATWAPLRRIAIASPYEYFRVPREFTPQADRGGDPLLLRYFDDLSLDLVAESEKLVSLYHEECVKTGVEVCQTAMTSGLAAMLIERATKEAVFLVAGIEPVKNRSRLERSIEAYHAQRRANNESPFFAAALDPARGPSAKAASELLVSLRADWDAMQAEFAILAAGDERNFDLRQLLAIQARLVQKVERLTGALVRYASVTYGG